MNDTEFGSFVIHNMTRQINLGSVWYAGIQEDNLFVLPDGMELTITKECDYFHLVIFRCLVPCLVCRNHIRNGIRYSGSGTERHIQQVI